MAVLLIGIRLGMSHPHSGTAHAEIDLMRTDYACNYNENSHKAEVVKFYLQSASRTTPSYRNRWRPLNCHPYSCSLFQATLWSQSVCDRLDFATSLSVAQHHQEQSQCKCPEENRDDAANTWSLQLIFLWALAFFI